MYLNSGTADVFTPVSIVGASDQLKESMHGIAKTSAHLECLKLQQQIAEETQCLNREKAECAARARVHAVMVAQREMDNRKKTENPKKAKKDPATLDKIDDDEDDDDDLEELMKGAKGKRKTALILKYVAATGGYPTTGKDRKTRMMARQAKIDKELEEALANAPQEPEEDDNQT